MHFKPVKFYVALSSRVKSCDLINYLIYFVPKKIFETLNDIFIKIFPDRRKYMIWNNFPQIFQKLIFLKKHDQYFNVSIVKHNVRWHLLCNIHNLALCLIMNLDGWIGLIVIPWEVGQDAQLTNHWVPINWWLQGLFFRILRLNITQQYGVQLNFGIRVATEHLSFQSQKDSPWKDVPNGSVGKDIRRDRNLSSKILTSSYWYLLHWLIDQMIMIITPNSTIIRNSNVPLFEIYLGVFDLCFSHAGVDPSLYVENLVIFEMSHVSLQIEWRKSTWAAAIAALWLADGFSFDLALYASWRLSNMKVQFEGLSIAQVLEIG